MTSTTQTELFDLWAVNTKNESDQFRIERDLSAEGIVNVIERYARRVWTPDHYHLVRRPACGDLK